MIERSRRRVISVLFLLLDRRRLIAAGGSVRSAVLCHFLERQREQDSICRVRNHRADPYAGFLPVLLHLDLQ